jgi:hypothetical protein
MQPWAGGYRAGQAGQTFIKMGWLYLERGDKGKALECFERALECYKMDGNEQDIARVLGYIETGKNSMEK